MACHHTIMPDREKPFPEGPDREAVEPATTPTVRWSFILTLWMEAIERESTQPSRESSWRGCIETPARQRTYFGSMTKLTEYLTAVTGWKEPPG